jgi:hypothetical protein
VQYGLFQVTAHAAAVESVRRWRGSQLTRMSFTSDFVVV